jgi:hypothetical protein
VCSQRCRILPDAIQPREGFFFFERCFAHLSPRGFIRHCLSPIGFAHYFLANVLYFTFIVSLTIAVEHEALLCLLQLQPQMGRLNGIHPSIVLRPAQPPPQFVGNAVDIVVSALMVSAVLELVVD